MHLLVEYWDCAPAALREVETLEALLHRAAQVAGAHVLESVFHRFGAGGVSGVLVVAESHLSIHTWPEQGYAAVDFYTCGDTDTLAAHEVLLLGLGAGRHERLLVRRGMQDGRTGLEICSRASDAHPSPKVA